ncbi:MAG: S-layer homology domain-containing protein [Bacillota bacterium]
MKRSLIVLLTIAVLLFAFAGVAAASEEASASKLNALGIIEGYPDGTFGLERNITRAEFTKVAVVLAGLQDAADLLKDTPSQFTDVKAGVWYTGWINLAASQGFVKGYPDGTFKPNDNISYSEVLTVLLRIVGYNDNLPGMWPTNYISKAAQLGVTKGVSFDAKGMAVRGKVFILADQTLDQDVVQWKASDGIFEEKSPVRTLLEDTFDGFVSKEVFIKDWSYDPNKDEFTLLDLVRIESHDGNAAFSTGYPSIKVAKNAVISGAKSVPDLSGKIAIFLLNDDDEAVSIIVKDYGVVTDKDILRVSDTRVETDKDGKRYTLAAANIPVTGFGSSASDWSDVNSNQSADRLTLMLNKKGEVVAIKKNDFANYAILSEVTAAKRIVYHDNFGSNPRITDQLTSSVDYMIIKGGEIVGLDALKEYDTLRVSKNAKGLAWLIYVSSEKVTGELDSIEINSSNQVTKIKVDGKSYDVKNPATLSFSTDGDSFAALTSADTLDAYYGEEVTLILNGLGKVGAIIADEAGTSGWMYGVVKTWSLDYKGGGASAPGSDIGKDKINSITILTENGSKKYTVTSDSDSSARNVDPNSEPISFDKGSFVKFNLDDDGAIKNFDVQGKIADLGTEGKLVGNKDKDTWQVQIGGVWYTLTADTVIFDISEPDSDDWQVVGRSAGWDALNANRVYVKISGGHEVEYLVTTLPATTTGDYAVVMGKGVNKDGRYVTINDGGTTTTYNTVSNSVPANYNDLRKHQIVEYNISGSKLSSATILVGRQDGTTNEGFNWELKAGATSVADGATHAVKAKYSVAGDVYQFEVTRVNRTQNSVQIKLFDKNGNIVQNSGSEVVYNLVVDKDTVIYDISGDNPVYADLDDVFVGSVVGFGIKTNTNIITWMAIIE